jgi:murein DD-endopeptidase MepM/ murein hydrolase activator NlpD
VSLDPSIRAGDAAPGGATTAAKAGGPDAKRLAQLGTEFESMLLLQMLREMRKSGSWKDESEDKEGYGAEALFDTVDAELAMHLAKAQGFGLGASIAQQIAEQIAGPAGTALPVQLPSNLPSMVPASMPLERRAAPLGAVAMTNERMAEVDGEVKSEPTATLEPELPPAELTVSNAAMPGERVTTSPFGWRRDPFSGAATYHRGVDLRAAYGESIGAAATGRVVFAGEQGGYGQTVVLEHPDGMRTRYAHLSAVLTEVGAEVGAGAAIGRAGHSGRATGTHLHFEVTQNGRPVDPWTLSDGGLKPERVVADWAVGVGTTLPEVHTHDQTGRRR